MDRKIDERLRKPRRTKGTPFYVGRNYWAGGIILVGGIGWFLLELTPGFRAFKKYQKEDLKDSEDLETRLKHMQIAHHDPIIGELLYKARERIAYKDEPKPQGWLAKFFTDPDF